MSPSEILMLVHKNHWMNEWSFGVCEHPNPRACSNIVKNSRNMVVETSIEDGWWCAGLVEALLSPLTRHLPLISAGYRTPAICCISGGWIVALFAMVDRSVRGLQKPAKGQPFWEGSPLLISYIFASDPSGEVERYEVARLLLLPLLWPAADTALPTHLHSRQWTLGRDQSWKRTFAKFLLSTRRRP